MRATEILKVNIRKGNESQLFALKKPGSNGTLCTWCDKNK